MFTKFAASASASAAAIMGFQKYQNQFKQRTAFAESLPAKVPFFNSGVHNNPHFEKRYKGGEDGYVISDNKRLIGVADGVGGWAKKEVCSGKTSKFLCAKIGQLFKEDNSAGLKDLLIKGVEALTEKEIEGSTTVVLAKLDPEEDEQ